MHGAWDVGTVVINIWKVVSVGIWTPEVVGSRLVNTSVNDVGIAIEIGVEHTRRYIGAVRRGRREAEGNSDDYCANNWFSHSGSPSRRIE